MKRLLVVGLMGLAACGGAVPLESSAAPATTVVQATAPIESAIPPTLSGMTPTAASAVGPMIGTCSQFPPHNIWNARVDSLPIHAKSAEYIASIGGTTIFHADFGSEWEGQEIGIPYVLVNGGQAVQVDFDEPDESDPSPYIIPPNAPIEDGGDRHVLVVDQSNCKLYELFAATKLSDTHWQAYSGAIFDLRSNALRPAGWTSADAAGLPILPGLVRYDEVQSGIIRHAIRFTAVDTQRAYVWPARHYASDITDVNVPPMGARFRLKSGYDISGFSPQVQVIAQAMKDYGIILADNGSDWYISGSPHPDWDNDMLHELDVLVGNDFEAVDVSGLMIDPDSGAIPWSGGFKIYVPQIRAQHAAPVHGGALHAAPAGPE